MGYIVTILAGLIVVVSTQKISNLFARFFLMLGVSFIVAYCSYWLPFWFDQQDGAQYEAWQLIGVGMYFIPALIVGLLAMIVIKFINKR